MGAAFLTLLPALPGFAQDQPRGSLVTETIVSESLRSNLTGLDPRRSVIVYLPADYATSGRSYPVIYYLHSLGMNNVRLFADGRVQRTLDRAIGDGVMRGCIFVAADYSSPGGCFFENSSTSGHWLDFIVKELVPFVDGRYRTLPQRDSRGVAGDFMGGYGALKLGMLYPDMFSVVYALHPVATGTGVVPMRNRPNWERIHHAKSLKDLEGDVFSQVFIGMAQAYLPNPDRPPFYCDFLVEPKDGTLQVDVAHTEKLQGAFLLDHLPLDTIGNLRRMRGVAFDWARYDPNVDHVFSNQAFTRKLDELGVEHEADEYRGTPGPTNWTDDGRVYREMMPFFNRHLVFAGEAR